MKFLIRLSAIIISVYLFICLLFGMRSTRVVLASTNTGTSYSSIWGQINAVWTPAG